VNSGPGSRIEVADSTFTVYEEDVPADDDEVTATIVTDEERPWDEEVEVIVALAVGLADSRRNLRWKTLRDV
jgi:hypothetical protein